MKTNHHIIIVAAIGALFLTATNGFSQGSLTPPGAPAAMMKSLDQIEPRTPVNTNTTPGNSFAQYVIRHQPARLLLSDRQPHERRREQSTID